MKRSQRRHVASPWPVGRYRWWAWLFFLVGGWCTFAGPTTRADALIRRLEEVIDAPRFRQAQWGVLVCDLTNGDILYERNADRLFAPASTTKLFTCAAALGVLGADYRFRTVVYRRGELNAEGRLDGDLVLWASGDPTLGGRTTATGEIAFANVDHTYCETSNQAELTEPDPLAGLDQLAAQVYAAGIRHVAGEVWIDARRFEVTESTGSGPTRVYPIVVNDNVIDVECRPGAAGEPARVSWRPAAANWQVENRVRTVPAGQANTLKLSVATPARLVVSGNLAENSGPRLLMHEVDDPVRWARSLWIEALARAGVSVAAPADAELAEDRLPAVGQYQDWVATGELLSPPLAQELRLVLKVSHNLHASLLPLALAAERGRRTLREGMAVEAQFLSQAGVDVASISFGGGAGGSRADYVTPRATVQLLRHMATRQDFEVFRQALPRLGVDGTLFDAVPESSPARGRAQAKTGTYYWYNALNDRYLLLSKALAGYLTTAGGRELAFSFVVNQVHLDTPEGRVEIGQKLGHLCEILHEER